MRVRLKRGKRDAEVFCGGSHAIKTACALEIVENGVARGGGDRMSL